MERCITDRLLNFYELANFFTKFQFGFRKGLSTVHSLINLTENIYNSLNLKNHHLSVITDLTKAFDMVHHRIFLSKLDKSGLWGTALDWFFSYLSNREYFVKQVHVFLLKNESIQVCLKLVQHFRFHSISCLRKLFAKCVQFIAANTVCGRHDCFRF